MSGVFISPPLFHLLSKPWCHQFQGTKFLTQALDRESQFFVFFFFLFARFAGHYPECVECLSPLGGGPGLIHRTVNSGLAMPCSIQIRTHLCVPGHCWGWHMLVGRREAWPLSLHVTSSVPCWEGQVAEGEMAQCEWNRENMG